MSGNFASVGTSLKNSYLVEESLRVVDRVVHHRLAGRLGSAGDVVRSDRWFRGFATGRTTPQITPAHADSERFVDYIADPFLVSFDGKHHLYYELFGRHREPTGVIGHSVSTDGGDSWSYDGVALDPGCHVSFPFVHEHEGRLWMVPNLNPGDDPSVLLYESADGSSFEPVSTLTRTNDTPTDRVVFRYDGRWWLLVAVSGDTVKLCLFHAAKLTDEDWTPHQQNPVIVGEPRIPAGSPHVGDESILLFFQDGPKHYGESVHAYTITELSPRTYADRRLKPSQVVGPSDSPLGWASGRMHTFDCVTTADKVLCAVDGDTDLGSSLVGPNWAVDVVSCDRPVSGD